MIKLPNIIILVILLANHTEQQSQLIFNICKTAINECQFDKIDNIDMIGLDEKVSYYKLNGLICDLSTGFNKFNATIFEKITNNCSQISLSNCIISLKPFSISGRHKIFNRNFGFQKFLDFMRFYGCRFLVRVSNLKGIGLDLFDNWDDLLPNPKYDLDMIGAFEFVNIRIDFYVGKRRIHKCQELIDANLTRPRSAFQVSTYEGLKDLLFFGCQFKHVMCPLVFNGANVENMRFHGVFNTLFKRNYPRFTTERYDELDVTVRGLEIFKTYGLVLDSIMLNPQIFRKVEYILVEGGLLLIDTKIFSYMKRYKRFNLSTIY